MKQLKVLLASLFLLISSDALSQEKSLIITTPDSIYVSHQITMDSLLVTPDKTPQSLQRNRTALSHGNPIHKLAAETDLTTVIPGVTADLERDLPGLITFYSANGLPVLTKHTQNHSLTPTIPYALIRPELKEPNAVLSGSDAVVTLTPGYAPTRNVFFDPLHQGASIATGERKSFSAVLVTEHSSPKLLEGVIEELSAYAETYSGLGAARFRRGRTEVEVIAQHQYSDNEFGALFDVHLFRETDRMSAGFASATHDLGVVSLEAGYGYQQAKARTELEEVYKDYHVETDELQAHSYKFAFHANRTSLAVLYHDVQRTLPDTATGVRDIQLILSKNFALTNRAHLNMAAKLDHHDQITKPSMSIEAVFAPSGNLFVEASIAHLYDPITNQSMHSGLRDGTARSEPITTNYASLQLSYQPAGWKFMTSITAKDVSLSWYEQPATIKGIILGGSAERTITWDDRALAMRITARKRWMDLDVINRQTQQMPGPAPVQVGMRTEYATGGFGVSLEAHFYSSRTQSLSEDLSTSLGELLMLNAGVTKQIGSVNAGLSIGNIIGMFRENKMYAYQQRINESESRVEYIVAPPFIPGISMSIDF
ncbi:hypothetical protein BH23BAC3_BH23BAC3_14170 [soil metagenome]